MQRAEKVLNPALISSQGHQTKLLLNINFRRLLIICNIKSRSNWTSSISRWQLQVKLTINRYFISL